MNNLDQTAVSMIAATEFSFEQTNVLNLHEQVMYLPTDWALINSRGEYRLIKYIQKKHDWELFVRCFNHWLKLVLQGLSQDLTSPLNESLMFFFYCLYHKSLKKLQKYKCLSKTLAMIFKCMEMVLEYGVGWCWNMLDWSYLGHLVINLVCINTIWKKFLMKIQVLKWM